MFRIITQRTLDKLLYNEYLKGLTNNSSLTRALVDYQSLQHGSKSLADLQIEDILNKEKGV